MGVRERQFGCWEWLSGIIILFFWENPAQFSFEKQFKLPFVLSNDPLCLLYLIADILSILDIKLQQLFK